MKSTTVFLFLNLFACLSLHAQTAADLVEIGESEVQQGNYEQALAHYNQAIEKESDYMDAFLNRAFVYSMLKDYEKAVSDYTKIIELNQNFVFAYLSRGSAFNKLKKFDEAMTDFNRVIELDPENSEAYNNRGWSRKGLGDHDGACKDWKISKKMGNDEAKIILKNNQC